LFTEYENSLGSESKERKLYALIYEMARHSAQEELVVYPFIACSGNIPDGARIAQKNQQDHQVSWMA
jgi:hypothetical protein